MHELPDVVRRKAELAGAERWIVELPDLIESSCARWSLTVDGVLDGGTEAHVLAVTWHEADRPAVLKLCIPRDGEHAANEIAVLEIAGGAGCAELLRSDAPTGALLMERLGPSLFELAPPVARRHEVMCAAASAMWHRLPSGAHGFTTGAAKGRWLADFITETWERLDRPCTEAAVAYALDCAERRVAAHEPERAVLVHGDVHQWNTLATLDGGSYKLIDPDGLHAEPEYDLGIIMREDPVELLTDPRERSRRLARLTGRDEAAIWEWGVVERVSTGLLCAEIGLQPVGRNMLATAEHVAET